MRFPEVFLPAGKPLPKTLEEVGVEVTHHMVGDGYVKLTAIPAGQGLVQHRHRVNHESSLLIGKAVLEIMTRPNPVKIEIHAPWHGTLLAHTHHQVTAVTPCLWACIWDNPEGLTDPDAIDQRVIE